MARAKEIDPIDGWFVYKTNNLKCNMKRLVAIFATTAIALLFAMIPGLNSISAQPTNYGNRLGAMNGADNQAGKPTIHFHGGWDSVTTQVQLAKYIAENGYGYPTSGGGGNQWRGAEAIIEGLSNSSTSVDMEFWLTNYRVL